MIYRCVIWKNPDAVIIPNDVDRDTFDKNNNDALNNFETNYKSKTIKINTLIKYDVVEDYNTFSSNITDWSTVQYYEDNDRYILYRTA